MWHVNNEGQIKKCRAGKGRCPYRHYRTKSDAYVGEKHRQVIIQEREYSNRWRITPNTEKAVMNLGFKPLRNFDKVLKSVIIDPEKESGVDVTKVVHKDETSTVQVRLLSILDNSAHVWNSPKMFVYIYRNDGSYYTTKCDFRLDADDSRRYIERSLRQLYGNNAPGKINEIIDKIVDMNNSVEMEILAKDYVVYYPNDAPKEFGHDFTTRICRSTIDYNETLFSADTYINYVESRPSSIISNDEGNHIEIGEAKEGMTDIGEKWRVILYKNNIFIRFGDDLDMRTYEMSSTSIEDEPYYNDLFEFLSNNFPNDVEDKLNYIEDFRVKMRDFISRHKDDDYSLKGYVFSNQVLGEAEVYD